MPRSEIELKNYATFPSGQHFEAERPPQQIPEPASEHVPLVRNAAVDVNDVPVADQKDEHHERVLSPYQRLNQWLGYSSFIQRTALAPIVYSARRGHQAQVEDAKSSCGEIFLRGEGFPLTGARKQAAYVVTGILNGVDTAIRGTWRVVIGGFVFRDLIYICRNVVNQFGNSGWQIVLGTSTKEGTLSSSYQYEAGWVALWLTVPLTFAVINGIRYARWSSEPTPAQQPWRSVARIDRQDDGNRARLMDVADAEMQEQQTISFLKPAPHFAKKSHLWLQDIVTTVNDLARLKVAWRFDRKFLIESREKLLTEIKDNYQEYPWYVRLELLHTLKMMATSFVEADRNILTREDRIFSEELLQLQEAVSQSLNEIIDQKISSYSFEMLYAQYCAWKSGLIMDTDARSIAKRVGFSLVWWLGSLSTARYLELFYQYCSGRSIPTVICRDFPELNPTALQTPADCLNEAMRFPRPVDFLIRLFSQLKKVMRFDTLDFSNQRWYEWDVPSTRQVLANCSEAATDLHTLNLSSPELVQVPPKDEILDLWAEFMSSHPLKIADITNQQIAPRLFARQAFPTTLVKLRLSQSGLTDEQYPGIQTLIQNNLEELDVSWNADLSNYFLEQLTTTLTQFAYKLSTLLLDGITVDTGLTTLASRLNETNINTLSVSGIILSPDLCDALGNGTQNSRVTTLIANDCQMGDDGANRLFSYFTSSPLQTFQGRNNGFTDDCAQAFASGMGNLTHIDVSQNRLGDNFLNTTAPAIRYSGLIQIDISSNPDFTDVGIAQFSQAFPPTLQILGITNCNAGNLTAQAVGQFIATSSVFIHLDIAENNLDSYSVAILLRQVKQNPQFARLIIDGNDMSSAEVGTALAELLPQLTKLKANDARLSADNVGKLSVTLPGARIEELDLHNNPNLGEQSGKALVKATVATPAPELLDQLTFNADEKAALSGSKPRGHLKALDLQNTGMTTAAAVELCHEQIYVNGPKPRIDLANNPLVDDKMIQPGCVIVTSSATRTQPLFIFNWMKVGVSYVRDSITHLPSWLQREDTMKAPPQKSFAKRTRTKSDRTAIAYSHQASRSLMPSSASPVRLLGNNSQSSINPNGSAISINSTLLTIFAVMSGALLFYLFMKHLHQHKPTRGEKVKALVEKNKRNAGNTQKFRR